MDNIQTASNFANLTLTDALTITAIITGPVIALFITWIRDNRKEKRQRKLEIFRSLMKTRGIRLDPEHVVALNLIELEFYGDDNVLTAFRAYLQHLSDPQPMPEEQDRFFQRRHDLFVNFLSAVGENCGYRFDKHDLYQPQLIRTHGPISGSRWT